MAVMAFDFKVLGLSRQHIRKGQRDRERERKRFGFVETKRSRKSANAES